MRALNRVEGDYSPQKHCVPILEAAMRNIQSVPYKVTLRWVFYRLVQEGIYSNKKDYFTFSTIQAKAKKRFYKEWRPDILADDTREFILQGNGFEDTDEWLDAIASRLEYKSSIWNSQKHYIELWFEAGAMVAQFKYYAPDIPLFSFHGDCSIAPKWEAAKRLEEASDDHGLPIVIFYFGDEDEKGMSIPESAVQDIKKWCDVPFEFIRAGLNLGDGKRLGLNANPDKPGTYQWEALNDEQARNVIESALFEYFDKEAADDLRHSDEDYTSRFRESFQEYIQAWKDDESNN